MQRREKLLLEGHAGLIEAILEWQGESATEPPDEEKSLTGIALVAHPHPLHGGTMDNKVTQTLAKSFVECGMAALRFNFRGVGKSEGEYDAGTGECADMIFLAKYLRNRFPKLPLFAGGFSFGAFVTAEAQSECDFQRLVLIGTAVGRFAVKKVPEQTILIHGSVDETVPLTQVLDWAEPQKLTVHVFTGADHFFHQRLIPLRHLITTMLNDGQTPSFKPNSINT